MKQKAKGWIAIILAAGIITFGILDIIAGTYYFAIGIPIGIYTIFRFLPDVLGNKA